MKLQRRVARLESAALQMRPSQSEGVSPQSFGKKVEARMRLKRESLETACQAVAIHLEDDELDALLAQAEASVATQEMVLKPFAEKSLESRLKARRRLTPPLRLSHT